LIYLPHRDLAAFLAISDRFLAVIPAARALLPMRPSATAAALAALMTSANASVSLWTDNGFHNDQRVD
jgi:hypothetical protein